MTVTQSLLFKYICFKSESTARGKKCEARTQQRQPRDMASIIKVVPLQMTKVSKAQTLPSCPILQMGNRVREGGGASPGPQWWQKQTRAYHPVSGSSHLPGTHNLAKSSLFWAFSRTRNWSPEAERLTPADLIDNMMLMVHFNSWQNKSHCASV